VHTSKSMTKSTTQKPSERQTSTEALLDLNK
jgi:hypothetical protein